VEPCSEKENISKLFQLHEEKIKQLQGMEVRQVEIQGDIKHIKGRIDNGMSHTIHDLNQMLTKLEPVIGHHSDTIKRIEGIGWTLSTALILTLIGLIGWAIAHGFTLKL
jgi:hypothetical protein